MADTRILEEYKITSAEEWQKLIHELENVEEMSLADKEVLAQKIEIIFPELKTDLETGLNNVWGKAQGMALNKLKEINVENVPSQIEELRRRFEEAQKKSAQDVETTAQKIKNLNARSAQNRKTAEKLPEAVISTGKILNIEKPEEIVQKASDERHYNPETGKIEGIVPQSDQKKQELKSEATREERNKEKYERYHADADNIDLYTAARGLGIPYLKKWAEKFGSQLGAKGNLPPAQPVEKKGLLGNLQRAVESIKKTDSVKPEEQNSQPASVERVAPERKSAASIDRLQRAAAVSGTVGGVFGVWNSLKNTVREGIIGIKRESSKEIPQQRPVSTVEKSINTARFEKKPSKDGETQRASRIYDPRAAGVVKNTVSPGSNLGMMERAKNTASRVVSFDSFMNIFDIFSRGSTSVIRLFQGALTANSTFLWIFLATLIIPAGALIFFRLEFDNAMRVPQSIGPRGDYKSAKPLAPFTLTKTANYNPQTGIITYAINGPENGQDTLKIIYKNGNSETKTGGKTFDASGLKDATVINTYTVNKISATAVTVVGNGPLEAIGCPIVNIDRGVSLGSQNGKAGHCGDNYKAPEVCKGGETPWRGNEMAMDIYSAQNMVGEPVVLPAVTINGKVEQIDWVYRGTAGDVDASQGFVQYVSKKTFLDPADNKQKYLLVEMHHLDKNNINTAADVKSGTVVGALGSFSDGSSSPHVHIQFGTGEQITGAGVVNPQGVTWVKAETFLQHCETPPV